MWFSLLEYPILQHRVPNRAFIVQGRPDYSWSSSQKPENQGTMQTPRAHCVMVCRMMTTLGSKELTAKSEHGLHSLTAGFEFYLFFSVAVWHWANIFSFCPSNSSLYPSPFSLLPEKPTFCKMCAQTCHWVQPVEDLRRTAGCRKTVESLFFFCIPFLKWVLS